ncbi:hypothetical protein [Streptomyces naphthomycinicus]|uniref:hypothetical protein n=1 Tax=Streptomyces naphthomycinicus TaxID=2872625 RepID=UPI001CEC2C83|nr:hypothetical protein [Streptomyces sp. TML10]
MTTAFTLAAGTSQFTTSTVTTAGAAVGLALLGTEHWRWYKGGASAGPGGGGGRDPKALIPFWFGLTFGILMVACPSGALGDLAGILRWGGNGAGGTVMGFFTGQDPATIATASAPTLDGYGATVVTALVIVLWLLRKQFAKLIKGKWWKGVATGALLCFSTGVAATVAQLVIGNTNGLGRYLFDSIVHGTPL